MQFEDRELLIHVGLPKTGTTTLQESLFPGHPEIEFFGKHIKNNITKGCLTQEHYRFFKALLWDFSKEQNVTDLKKTLHQDLLKDVDPSKKLVCSWESLGNAGSKRHEKRLKRIKAVFGSCRLIIALRNPLTQIPSEYLQNIEGNFIKRKRKWMGNASYLGLEEWFSRKVDRQKSEEGSLESVFAYAKNIQTAVELLGRENVGVFLFEDLIKDPDLYYQRICEFIRVDPAEGVRVTKSVHKNKMTSQGQLKYMQKIGKSYWRNLFMMMGGEKYRRQMYRRNIGDGTPAKVSLPPSLDKNIRNATRSGNRWIADEFNLPLEELGYPV